MTDKEQKILNDNLWHSADILRQGAHLAANKYGQLILGLIFFATSTALIELLSHPLRNFTVIGLDTFFTISFTI